MTDVLIEKVIMSNPNPGDHIYVIQTWDETILSEPALCLVAQDVNGNLIWNHKLPITFLAHCSTLINVETEDEYSFTEEYVCREEERPTAIFTSLTTKQQLPHFIWVVADDNYYRLLKEKI